MHGNVDHVLQSQSAARESVFFFVHIYYAFLLYALPVCIVDYTATFQSGLKTVILFGLQDMINNALVTG